MATIAHPADLHQSLASCRKPIAAECQTRPGLLRRLLAALMASRQLKAQRDIDRYVSRHGRTFTDSFEREIGQRMMGPWWTAGR
jgi:hypothetical protein